MTDHSWICWVIFSKCPKFGRSRNSVYVIWRKNVRLLHYCQPIRYFWRMDFFWGFFHLMKFNLLARTVYIEHQQRQCYDCTSVETLHNWCKISLPNLWVLFSLLSPPHIEHLRIWKVVKSIGFGEYKMWIKYFLSTIRNSFLQYTDCSYFLYFNKSTPMEASDVNYRHIYLLDRCCCFHSQLQRWHDSRTFIRVFVYRAN